MQSPKFCSSKLGAARQSVPSVPWWQPRLLEDSGEGSACGLKQLGQASGRKQDLKGETGCGCEEGMEEGKTQEYGREKGEEQ